MPCTIIMLINHLFVGLSVLLIKYLCILTSSMPETTIQPGLDLQPNPLFPDFNKPYEFSKFTAASISAAAGLTIERCNVLLNKIVSNDENEKNYENTFLLLDDLYNEFGKAHALLELMSSVLTDVDKRNAALDAQSVLGKYYNEIHLNEDLYQSLKNYSLSEDGNRLTDYKKRFSDDVIRTFERNGFALPKEKRNELKVIFDMLNDLEIAFNNNIEIYHDEIIFTQPELSGLPEDYLDQRKQPDGTFLIDLSYPSYHPFMKYCRNDDSRRKLYMKFTTKAAQNKEVLKDILVERKKMALLLGFDTYATYSLDDNMAKTPKNVWDFENNLEEKIKPKAKKDYAELLSLKSAESGKDETVIYPWQSAYYSNLVLEKNYNLNNELLKQYFELNNVLDGIFVICSKLFKIDFEEIRNADVWHEEVRMFEVKQNGKLCARFYLDLFPRKNKYSHAACFGMIDGKQTMNGYQLPVASLVCNFPKSTKSKPSLLTHDDVETMFHEFGHVLHHLLTASPVYYYSGTNVAIDFVEVPSQLFENWAWEYESLKLFARHYQTNEPLPGELHDKMIASKNAGSGIFILQQIFYGVLDMTLHDRYDAQTMPPVNHVVKELQGKITFYPFVEGTHFETSFGHLCGYAAGYYSYLWSKVYADDMFDEMKKTGILNYETGDKYHRMVLSKGGTQEELTIVKDFLGREPDSEAFLKGYGII